MTAAGSVAQGFEEVTGGGRGGEEGGGGEGRERKAGLRQAGLARVMSASGCGLGDDTGNVPPPCRG
jgi:hypothetical protein